jgi:hypothetical protein
MTLKIHISPAVDVLPPAEELADAGRYGIEVLVKNHLIARNGSRPQRGAMPKSNFYANAARSVTSSVNGNKAEVTINQLGVALHYYGGIVLPTNGRKALAIPKHPAVHDQKPSEMDPSRQILKLIWPKGSSAGTLRHKDSGEVYFLLVSKANIPADRSVLPTEAAMQDAATKAMESII